MSGMSLFTLYEYFELKMTFDQLDSLKTLSLLSIATQTAPHRTLNDPLNLKHAHSMATNVYEYLHSQSRLRLARFPTVRLHTMTCATQTAHLHPLVFFHICAKFRHSTPKTSIHACHLLCEVCVTGSLVKVDQRILHRCVNF